MSFEQQDGPEQREQQDGPEQRGAVTVVCLAYDCLSCPRTDAVAAVQMSVRVGVELDKLMQPIQTSLGMLLCPICRMPMTYVGFTLPSADTEGRLLNL